MSWTDKLLETYEMCSTEVGKGDQNSMLLPIGHLTQNAQIEVVLDLDGNFMTATELDLSEAVTVIPVSEDSASRGNGIAPHPLHDKLVYVAQDYAEYVEDDKQEYHETYMKNLKQWVDSPYTHRLIRIIYHYLSKGHLIKDFIQEGIFTEIDGKLDKKKKFQKVSDATSVFVRFRVDGGSENILEPWKDTSLYQSFIDYYRSIHQETDICYVSGKQMYCTDKHQAKLRYSGDKGKLISSNDASGFTFRGRLAGKEEANSMGYETSQKIHHALRWLIHNQGYQKNGLTIVIWNAKMLPMKHQAKQLFGKKEVNKLTTEKVYAENAYKSIDGYREELTKRDDVMIMLLESATTGRISITGYQELKVSQYYENVKQWYTECKWSTPYSPTPNDIINVAYGTYRKGEFVTDEKIYRMNLKRLLPCILMGKRVPKDIIANVYQQVLTMSKVDEKAWKTSMNILCSLARRESAEEERMYHKEGGIWSMSLEENKANQRETPAYIYGKMLAIYDEIEAKSLYESKEDRDTNAMRLYVEFKKFPWRTLNRIDSLVIPYINKLGSKATWLKKMIQEVCTQLHAIPEARDIRDLDYDFVLGFNCMKNEYWTSNKNDDEIKEENKDGDTDE